MKSLNTVPEVVMLLRRRDEPALFEYSSGQKLPFLMNRSRGVEGCKYPQALFSRNLQGQA